MAAAQRPTHPITSICETHADPESMGMRLGKKNAQHHTQATDFTNPTASNLFGA